MQVESALRALPDWIGEILQQCAAFRTAGDGPCARHVHRTRPECVFFLRRRRLLELFFRPATGILVSALPVFAVGQEVPPARTLILRLWRARHKRFFDAAAGAWLMESRAPPSGHAGPFDFTQGRLARTPVAPPWGP